MQLSSLHLNEDAVSPRVFISKDYFHGQFGRLTRERRASAVMPHTGRLAAASRWSAGTVALSSN